MDERQSFKPGKEKGILFVPFYFICSHFVTKDRLVGGRHYEAIYSEDD
jgi:hypothetical protein